MASILISPSCLHFLSAIVPITGEQPKSSRRAGTDVPYHPSYHGNILFKNVFQGHLAASDYPKVTVRDANILKAFQLTQKCFAVLLLYVPLLCCLWNRLGLVKLSALARLAYFTVLYSWAHWLVNHRNARHMGYGCLLEIAMLEADTLLIVYYRYLNAHGPGTASTIFLIVGKHDLCTHKLFNSQIMQQLRFLTPDGTQCHSFCFYLLLLALASFANPLGER